VLDVPMKRGRTFGTGDVATLATPNADVPIIISDALAAHVWGAVDPVGRRLKSADAAAPVRPLIVVGVVDDPLVRTRTPSEPWVTYMPADTTAPPRDLLIRTASAAHALLPAIRDVVDREAPGAVTAVNTLVQVEAENRRLLHLASGGIFAAGAIALLIAAIGLYAVVAFSVGQRTHEIAVRLAIGAHGNQIARAFVADGLKLSAIGTAIGLPLSLMALRVVMERMQVYDVPLSNVAVVAAMSVIGVAALAAWIPARRVGSVDPAAALRSV